MCLEVWPIFCRCLARWLCCVGQASECSLLSRSVKMCSCIVHITGQITKKWRYPGQGWSLTTSSDVLLPRVAKRVQPSSERFLPIPNLPHLCGEFSTKNQLFPMENEESRPTFFGVKSTVYKTKFQLSHGRTHILFPLLRHLYPHLNANGLVEFTE